MYITARLFVALSNALTGQAAVSRSTKQLPQIPWSVAQRRPSLEESVMRLPILQVSLVFVALAQSTAFGQCLSPWIERDGHLYRITEATDWFSAEAQAVQVGGHLTTINDSAENAWVLDNLMPFSPDQIAGLWIGLLQAEANDERL